ncbi:bifunctional DNA primase/polymerase [Streptomyces chartreusis]|uniref:bifunctional DNA primase/polymerase n=1 Tax=Streptomyces chartreusis TaxID=1969 RepID=UPI00380C3F51
MPAELWSSHGSPRQVPPQQAGAAGQSLATAQWCARRGWPVHPLAPGRKFPPSNCDNCRRPGHSSTGCPCMPAGRWCHGFLAATLDQRRICDWWGPNPQFGVGVACGPAHLVVIDIDAHPKQLPSRDRLLPGITIRDSVDLAGLTTGFHTLAILAALRDVSSPADDATTLRVRTPSGGLHVWYRARERCQWQCSSGSSQGRGLAWQVDVRAHGGYIVAPGTTTRSGTYTAIGDIRQPAVLPSWLAQELERTGHLPPRRVTAPRPVPARARQAVLAADGSHSRKTLSSVLAPVEACGLVPEGAGFSETLNRAAFTLGGLVAAGRLDQDKAERALQAAATAARPAQERRNTYIIRSGMDAGLKHPLYARSRP